MNQNRTVRTAVSFAAFRAAFLLVALFSAGCSALTYKATPEAKRTVVLVTNEYLTSIVRADLNKLNQMVAWPEYLEESHGRFTKRDYARQVMSLKNRWSNQDHPLLGLQVSDVSVGEYNAEVELKKKSATDDSPIKIRLLWDGNAWAIISDSLFGVDKRFSKLPQLS